MAVLVWLTGGLFDFLADTRGHATIIQTGSFTWTSYTAIGIIIAVIMFVTGVG
jgi:hypothetical protein